MNEFAMRDLLLKMQELFTVFGLKIIAAIAIFIIGRWASKALKKIVKKMMIKSNVDDTLISFVTSLTYVALMTFVALAALGQLGIQTTSFIAVIGAAGLAVGLALQGSLSNFASGVLMILFRPFKVGDFVETAGVSGIVEGIHIFTTTLKTGDNKEVIIPNSKITGDNIVNYSAKDTRRIDMIFGISYEDNIDRAKHIISDVLSTDSRILKDPAPTIGLIELGDSSVNFAVRPWVRTSDYWDVFFNTQENMKKRFDAEGLSIPFPQRDVHVYGHKAGDEDTALAH